LTKLKFFLVLIALNSLCILAIGQDNETTFGLPTADSTSLKGDIYYIPEGTSSLPDFSTLTPVGSIYTKVLNVTERSFDSGFPGVTDRFEWFAIRYTGTFQVENEGEYNFRLVSDDGSRLFIDGNKIIDDDGVHPAQSATGSVFLSKGIHQIEVDYFQGPRYYVALQLFWTTPGGTETISSPQYVPGSSSIDLTGVWRCDDGGIYYIRQLGDTIWWFGEPSTNPGGWSNVANGTIRGSIINLVWSDVPKGCNLNNGALVLSVLSKDKLTATDKTGGFGGSNWVRIGVTACPGSNITAPGNQSNPWENPNIRLLIDEWLLQQDKCVKNMYPGAYIDKWGRICGDVGNTRISCVLSPDHPLDWDNYHYLWFNNWCPKYYPYTVQSYIKYRQTGNGFDSMAKCKGESEYCIP